MALLSRQLAQSAKLLLGQRGMKAQLTSENIVSQLHRAWPSSDLSNDTARVFRVDYEVAGADLETEPVEGLVGGKL